MQTGYVKAEYCVTGEAAIALAKEVGNRIATVTTTTLFVREEPTVDSAVLGMVGLEDDLSVLQEDELDGWVKVPIEEGEGYVSTEFVELHTEFVKAESKAEEQARQPNQEAERKPPKPTPPNTPPPPPHPHPSTVLSVFSQPQGIRHVPPD